MRRSDAEDRLRLWFVGDKKIFKYVRFLAPTEYVVYIKDSDNKFRALPDVSTYEMEDLDAEEFSKLLMMQELVFDREFQYGSDTHGLKTGNCSCGSWILPDNEYLHTEGCRKHKK